MFFGEGMGKSLCFHILPYAKYEPQKIIWIWLGIIPLFGDLLLHAVQINNQILTQLFVVIYIAFGLYGVSRIYKEKRKRAYAENTG